MGGGARSRLGCGPLFRGFGLKCTVDICRAASPIHDLCERECVTLKEMPLVGDNGVHTIKGGTCEKVYTLQWWR